MHVRTTTQKTRAHMMEAAVAKATVGQFNVQDLLLMRLTDIHTNIQSAVVSIAITIRIAI